MIPQICSLQIRTGPSKPGGYSLATLLCLVPHAVSRLVNILYTPEFPGAVVLSFHEHGAFPLEITDTLWLITINSLERYYRY